MEPQNLLQIQALPRCGLFGLVRNENQSYNALTMQSIQTGESTSSEIPVLETRGLGFSYGSHQVITDVTFSVHSGEFAALVGPNGSGKTTLLRICLGLLRPKSGSANLFGVAPVDLREHARLGYVPQRPSLDHAPSATVAEVVEAGRLSRLGWKRRFGARDHEAVAHALESVALADLAKRRVDELSGGQIQRVLIARAFASEPELLVLDEPVAGVDAESQELFRNSLVHLVKEHRAAVLLVSHELGAVAGDLDRVIVLKNTVLFDGPPAQLSATGVSLGVHRDDLPLWLEGLR